MKLVGILNVTPDSFSDGGKHLEIESALKHSKYLVEAGADLVEIGGDSTRPGSTCVGPEEEWRRIEKIVGPVSEMVPTSIDTHHPRTAELALASGVSMINNVFASADKELCQLVVGTEARILLMHSKCVEPHVFGPEPTGDVVEFIKSSLAKRVGQALSVGVKESQVVLDPGMGAFISSDPKKSWEVLMRFHELAELGMPLMLACSRKGFLKAEGETEPSDRDSLSITIAEAVKRIMGGSGPDFVRVHDIEGHRTRLIS